MSSRAKQQVDLSAFNLPVLTRETVAVFEEALDSIQRAGRHHEFCAVMAAVDRAESHVSGLISGLKLAGAIDDTGVTQMSGMVRRISDDVTTKAFQLMFRSGGGR